ncbi:MAG: fluoride exporter [Frankiaceae bacterium]|jgi:CrcB protein|nr:fluoride exporter [Frankiaceae bacterium]
MPRPPIDPDLDPAEDAPHHPGARREPGPRSRWPRIAPTVVGLVFAGGCLGGWARYAVTTAWATPAGRFPWSTLWVNTAGAFVLGVVVVLAARGPRALRPLVGTGFCGGLTTFSALVVAADRLAAHGHAGTAIAYLVASTAAGLAAAWLGFAVTRRTPAGAGC